MGPSSSKLSNEQQDVVPNVAQTYEDVNREWRWSDVKWEYARKTESIHWLCQFECIRRAFFHAGNNVRRPPSVELWPWRWDPPFPHRNEPRRELTDEMIERRTEVNKHSRVSMCSKQIEIIVGHHPSMDDLNVYFAIYSFSLLASRRARIHWLNPSSIEWKCVVPSNLVDKCLTRRTPPPDVSSSLASNRGESFDESLLESKGRNACGNDIIRPEKKKKKSDRHPLNQASVSLVT